MGSNLKRKSRIIIEKNGVNMKILYENTEAPINRVWVTFPLNENDAVKQMLALTKGHKAESSITYRIADIDSPVRNLKKYLVADMPFDKLNELAIKIREMDKEDWLKFSGVLDCKSISGMEDVLGAAEDIESYEFIPSVTSNRELGGYLVQQGFLECPKHILPYLDYCGIGEEYYADHDCIFMKEGFIVRKESCQTMETGNTHTIQI